MHHEYRLKYFVDSIGPPLTLHQMWPIVSASYSQVTNTECCLALCPRLDHVGIPHVSILNPNLRNK